MIILMISLAHSTRYPVCQSQWIMWFTCGISCSLLRTVNQIPPGSPHFVHITSSQSLSSSITPSTYQITPNLKLISLTNLFLRSLSASVWSAFTDLGLGSDLVGTGVCLSFFFLFSSFSVTCARLGWPYSASSVHVKLLCRIVDWLSMVLRLRQHNIGYTADGFYRSDDPTNSVKALKEGG